LNRNFFFGLRLYFRRHGSLFTVFGKADGFPSDFGRPCGQEFRHRNEFRYVQCFCFGMLGGVDVALRFVGEDFVADKGLGIDLEDQQMVTVPAIKLIGAEERLRHGMFGLAAFGKFTKRF